MAHATIVYSGVRGTASSAGTLFGGKKIWFSDRVPLKHHFKTQVEANGGIVVPLEKQADILIVDHARKNPPPGSHSYTYVEKSVANGALEDLDDHIAGPPAGTVRPVGSTTMASRGGRTPFTEQDDQFLYDWVKTQEGYVGEKGNKIYEELQRANPRHTFQSWRDRWLKYVKFQNRELSRNRDLLARDEAPSTTDVPPHVSPRRTQAAAPSSKRVNEPLIVKNEFTDEEIEDLMDNYKDILKIDPDREQEAWNTWADRIPTHTALEWKHAWETKALPNLRAILKAGGKRSASRPKSKESVVVPGQSNTTIVDLEEEAEDTTPNSPEPLHRERQQHRTTRRSPSFRPSSPHWHPSSTVSKVSNGSPKSSRKPEKVTPQSPPKEAWRDQLLPELPDIDLDSHPSPKRKRNDEEEGVQSNSPQLPPSATQRRKKPRTRPFNELPLEIPSTPEADNAPLPEEEQAVDTRSRFHQPLSPLFVPEEEEPPPADNQPGPPTSPLNLKLFSDATSQPEADPEASRPTSPKAPPTRHESTEEEEDEVFETAPGGDIFETAPQNQDTETQRLFMPGETQNPDSTIPEPPSSPPLASAAKSNSGPRPLDDWIEEKVNEGVEEALVLDAAFKTSSDTALVDIVLRSVLAGKGVPGNVKGVWTDEDDAAVTGADARELKRVEDKHGKDGFNARFEYLASWYGE